MKKNINNQIDEFKLDAVKQEIEQEVEQEEDSITTPKEIPVGDYTGFETNPIKAIRKKCLDCCCEQIYEVRYCPSVNCPLHPFRFGKNPFRKKREYTKEEIKGMKDRISKARGKIGKD